MYMKGYVGKFLWEEDMSDLSLSCLIIPPFTFITNIYIAKMFPWLHFIKENVAKLEKLIEMPSHVK